MLNIVYNNFFIFSLQVIVHTIFELAVKLLKSRCPRQITILQPIPNNSLNKIILTPNVFNIRYLFVNNCQINI